MAGEILIISNDVVGRHMAGPGIRYYHLARVLSASFSVTLAVPAESLLDGSPAFEVLSYRSLNEPHVGSVVRVARAVLVPAVSMSACDALIDASVPLIVDGYDPVVAETLFLGGDETSLRQKLTRAYRLGDFYLCASERQRDWWLGLLEAYGRVNAHTFGDSPSLRRLIDVVPFGLPDKPLQHTAPAIKGVWDGIAQADKLILWGGGLWPWLDPLTAIRATVRVYHERQDIRLVFPGTRHPNPSMQGMQTYVEQAVELARDLGVLNEAVFFGDWIPYADWANVLAESDVALALHRDTLEARLAFRTRVLDYIWAAVPVVATRGDATSALIEAHGLGLLVDFGNEQAVSNALLTLLDDGKDRFRDRFARARPSLTWERVSEPLVRFCSAPYRAPDKPFLSSQFGNPAYENEITRLQALIDGYERGRFIRLMKWLHRIRQRVRVRS